MTVSVLLSCLKKYLSTDQCKRCCAAVDAVMVDRNECSRKPTNKTSVHRSFDHCTPHTLIHTLHIMTGMGTLAKELNAIRHHVEKGHIEKLVIAPIRAGIHKMLQLWFIGRLVWFLIVSYFLQFSCVRFAQSCAKLH